MYRLIRGNNYTEKYAVTKDSNGKPFLRNGKFISVTHFDGWTLVGVKKKNFGIDVERIRKVDDRMKSLLGLEKGSDIAVMMEWTRREAYIKKHNLKLGDITSLRPRGKIRTFLLYPYVLSVCE